jgi:thioesterase domain-containing protein
LQVKGDQPPIFWVHTIGEDNGGLFLYRRIIQHLDPDQPSYGIEAPVQPFHDLEGAAAVNIERLKAIQPHGPYYLAGYCFGGHLAFEMARQLEQRHESVGLLLLIETSAHLAHRPYLWRWRTLLDIAAHWYHWTADLLRRGPLDLGRRVAQRARTLPEQLKSSGNEAEAWARSLDHTFNFAMHPPSFREYAHAHWEALRKYRPGEYAGPAALLRIRKHGLTKFDPFLRWREICHGLFTMHIVPGDHVSIFDEPNVQTLARRCQQCLDTARESLPTQHRPG